MVSVAQCPRWSAAQRQRVWLPNQAVLCLMAQIYCQLKRSHANGDSVPPSILVLILQNNTAAHGLLRRKGVTNSTLQAHGCTHSHGHKPHTHCLCLPLRENRAPSRGDMALLQSITVVWRASSEQRQAQTPPYRRPSAISSCLSYLSPPLLLLWALPPDIMPLGWWPPSFSLCSLPFPIVFPGGDVHQVSELEGSMRETWGIQRTQESHF